MRFTKETARRAARTFFQAFLSYVVVNVVMIDFTADESIIKSAVIGLIVSALAAGFSALMNLESKNYR